MGFLRNWVRLTLLVSLIALILLLYGLWKSSQPHQYIVVGTNDDVFVIWNGLPERDRHLLVPALVGRRIQPGSVVTDIDSTAFHQMGRRDILAHLGEPHSEGRNWIEYKIGYIKKRSIGEYIESTVVPHVDGMSIILESDDEDAYVQLIEFSE